jgi:hypothetical protein
VERLAVTLIVVAAIVVAVVEIVRIIGDVRKR